MLITLGIVIICVSGIIIGLLTSKYVVKPTMVVITRVALYELAITQIVIPATYTPYPTYTLPPITPTKIPKYNPPKIITPTITITAKVSPTSEPIELVGFSWNVYPGDNAFIKIHTKPGIKCSIRFFDPLERPVEDQALASQISNEFGDCTWIWKIDEKMDLGVASVEISVENYKKTYIMQITAKE